jgi:hypothetical protein
LYSSPHVVQVIKMRMTEHMEHTAKIRNAYRVLMGKTAGKRPLGGLTHRWVDNIKTHIKETGWDRRFIRLGYGQVASCCAHGYEPSGFMKCKEFLNYLIKC